MIFLDQTKGVLALQPVFKKIGNTKEQDKYLRLFSQAAFLSINKLQSRDS